MLASLAHVIHFRRPPRIDFANLLAFCVNFPPRLIRRNRLDDSGKLFLVKLVCLMRTINHVFFITARRVFLDFRLYKIGLNTFFFGSLSWGEIRGLVSSGNDQFI